MSSYMGGITRGSYVQDLTAAFGTLVGALSSPVEATVGPVLVSVPVSHMITTYTLRQSLTGLRPNTALTEIDRDVLKIKCVAPAQF